MATQHKNGRFRATLLLNGSRKTFWGDSAEEAEDKKSQYIQRIATSPEIVAAVIGPLTPKTPLRIFAREIWYPTLNFLSPGTRAVYDSLWNSHIGPRFGERPIGEISFGEVQRHVNDLSARGRVDRNGDPTGMPLGAKKTRDVLDRLRAILQMAVQQGVIQINPALGVKGPKKPQGRVRVLTFEQAMLIKEQTHGERTRAAIVLAMFFGLRRGECAGAQWSHIDRINMTWSVCEQIRQEPGGAAPALPKNESVRTFHITPELLDLIDEVGNHSSNYICGWKGEKWLTPDNITADWGGKYDGRGRPQRPGIRTRFGMEAWHFHDLRHGAASILYRLGIDFLTVAAILGHKTPDTTLIYTDIDAAAMKKGMGTLGAELTRQVAASR